jgi:outer membrane protein assembly factor BamD (BamD/ComL family)
MVDFPESKNHREIRFLKAKANYEWAVNSIFEKQKERFLSTVELTNQFLKKYPSGKFVQDIKEIRKQALSKSNNPLYDRYQNASSGN